MSGPSKIEKSRRQTKQYKTTPSTTGSPRVKRGRCERVRVFRFARVTIPLFSERGGRVHLCVLSRNTKKLKHHQLHSLNAIANVVRHAVYFPRLTRRTDRQRSPVSSQLRIPLPYLLRQILAGDDGHRHSLAPLSSDTAHPVDVVFHLVRQRHVHDVLETLDIHPSRRDIGADQDTDMAILKGL